MEPGVVRLAGNDRIGEIASVKNQAASRNSLARNGTFQILGTLHPNTVGRGRFFKTVNSKDGLIQLPAEER